MNLTEGDDSLLRLLLIMSYTKLGLHVILVTVARFFRDYSFGQTRMIKKNDKRSIRNISKQIRMIKFKNSKDK